MNPTFPAARAAKFNARSGQPRALLTGLALVLGVLYWSLGDLGVAQLASRTGQQLGQASAEFLASDGQSFCEGFQRTHANLPAVVEVPFSSNPEDQGDGMRATFKLLHNVSLTDLFPVERRFSMYIYADDDIVSKTIARRGAWEKYEVAAVVKQLHQFAKANSLAPAEVYFMDIGANIGSFSLQVAAHGFSVVAFEPMYSNQAAVRLSLCANAGMEERVTLIAKGLGKQHMTCTLFSKKNNMGNGMMRCGTGSAAPPEGFVKRATLDVARLDDIWRESLPKELKGRLGAVKMDVEGHESLIVEGGETFFQEVSPPFIVSECDATLIEGATGRAGSSFLLQMARLGYKVFTDSGEIPAEKLADTACDPPLTVYFRKA